jgi:hypothetical protein
VGKEHVYVCSFYFSISYHSPLGIVSTQSIFVEIVKKMS